MNAFASALVEQRGTVDGTPRFTRLGDGRCAQIKPIVLTLESPRGGLHLMAANREEAWGRGGRIDDPAAQTGQHGDRKLNSGIEALKA